MSQIEELQARIMAAMDRISSGVDAALAAETEAAGPDTDLATALEEEKLANAQLEERLRVLKDKHRAEIDALQADQGEDGQGESGGDAERVAELEAELAELKATSEAQASEIASQAEQLKASDAQAEQLAGLDADLQRLRLTNQQLREANDALRSANAEGVGDPDLINKAMLAELEALRASQAADAAEVGAVMSKLNTLLSHARDLPEGEEA